MRLDVYLQSNGYVKSRTKAKEYIESGLVKVAGKIVLRGSFEVDGSEQITLEEPKNEYVSRGAHKLDGALETFCIDVSGKRCIDVGASTGGFTEVLLRRGAASVTAVDSGHGQLDPALAANEKVRNIEGCNARYMSAQEVGDGYDVGVMDVSFISQTYIFPALFPLINEDGRLVTLVKPQFELDSKKVGSGVVKKAEYRYEALLRVYDAVGLYGFCVKKAIRSSILGGDGNTEYLFYIERGEQSDSVRAGLKALSRNE